MKKMYIIEHISLKGFSANLVAPLRGVNILTLIAYTVAFLIIGCSLSPDPETLACPNSSTDWTPNINTDSNSDGCQDGTSESDLDGDGESDDVDTDDDGDNVLDTDDFCPNTNPSIVATGTDADADGCYVSSEGVDEVIFRQFITKWVTTTTDELITIPITGTGYNFKVDWGETPGATPETFITGGSTPMHTYKIVGKYDIKIWGHFPRISFNNTATDKDKIIAITQWGAIKWNSMDGAFWGCSKLTENDGSPSDIPNLYEVTSMDSMFRDATEFNQNLSAWNTAKVMSMASLFQNAVAFTQDISGWNVSSVTDMSNMFNGASVFNQDISGWDVSGVPVANQVDFDTGTDVNWTTKPNFSSP